MTTKAQNTLIVALTTNSDFLRTVHYTIKICIQCLWTEGLKGLFSRNCLRYLEIKLSSLILIVPDLEIITITHLIISIIMKNAK